MAVDAGPTRGGLCYRIDAGLAWLETALLVSLLLGLIALGCTQIVLRNFAASGIAWAEPVMRISVLWIGLLGALVATRQRRHVSVDLMSRYLPPLPQFWCGVVVNAFTGFISGTIAWHAGRLVYFEFTEPTLAFSSLPVWLAQSIMPLGFGLIALRYAIRVLRSLLAERRA